MKVAIKVPLRNVHSGYQLSRRKRKKKTGFEIMSELVFVYFNFGKFLFFSKCCKWVEEN